MFKLISDKVWVFDSEWVPDPLAGRLLYQLPESMSNEEVLVEMWKAGGATEEDPMPYLKTSICRVVSISAMIRSISNNEVKLRLLSLPREIQDSSQVAEAHILETFLNAVGKHKPQLVGYNSHKSDLRILVQRAVVNGIQAKDFSRRPSKPWEGVDYFARGSDFNIDLMSILGGWGKNVPSLHEMVTVCGIPGKIDLDGNRVAELWLKGELAKIVAYNEFDAVTTYLLWLRMAYFGGFFTAQQYQQEQELVLDLLQAESESSERRHLKDYISEWERLKKATSGNH